MTDIAICGACGKMGRVIADIIANREDCKTVAGIDKQVQVYGEFPIYEQLSQMKENPQVIIDFSHPSALDGLIEYCLSNAAALVIATTGYSQQQIEKIKAAAENMPIFFTFNMSMGINLLAELSKKAARVLGEQYDIEIVEKHHNQKIDAPSGTALMLADAVNSQLKESCGYVYDRHSIRAKRGKNEIGIHSVRGGTIVGEHEVIFAGRDEVITLTHQAYSKQVFAVGAVNAAVFLDQKPAGLYDMNDLIEG